MRIALAGTGAFGIKHLDGLANIDGVTVTAVVSRRLEQAEEVARKYGVGHATTDLDEVLARDDVDAVILCTPTQLHAGAGHRRDARGQARAGGDPGRRQLGGRAGGPARAGRRPAWSAWSGTPAGSTRRTSGCTAASPPVSWPSSRWMCRPTSSAGRTSTRPGSPAAGPITCSGITPRIPSTCSSTRPASRRQIAHAVQGPIHPELGIAMDMSIQLRTPVGQDLHAVAQLQQRRAARQLLPLHLRQRHLHRPVRRPGHRPRGADRRVRGRRLDQRHRAAGPGIRRGDHARAASRTPASPTSSAATGCSASWRPSWPASSSP